MWRVLLLEDDENDATIIRHELRDLANLSTVRDRASYESELTLFTNDVILADFSVPGFVDYEALTIRDRLAKHTPLIYVTGTLDDRVAAKTLRMGAADYILKSYIGRLAHSIAVALELNKTRARREQLHPVKAEILIVEDNEDILELLTQLFQVQNTVITAVTKIKDALEVVNKYFFHLALIDLQMPDGSGVEIVRKIKEVSRNCMVIITSGFPDMLTKAQGLGYIGVLMKPFSVSVAHEILRKHRLNYND